MEDTHRTQSVLNTALKQTEKSLRDELSFWRTQALQHTFCSCRAIQEYNMRKARNLAAESILGNPISTMSPSTKSATSTAAISPVTHVCGVHPDRRQSTTALEDRVASPATSSMALNQRDSFVAPQGTMMNQSGRHDSRRSSESMTKGPALSRTAEQDLKDFVSDVV